MMPFTFSCWRHSCLLFLSMTACALMVCSRNRVEAQTYSKLVVFGDSISDNGNVFRVSGGMVPAPPYYQGRFSNGPIWIDDLAAIPGVVGLPTEDFAYGGAHTDTTNVNSLLPGMQTEVNTYLALHPTLDSNALYILWGGGNDYLNGQTDPTVPVANLTHEITQLAQQGAKRFLIANQPNLGQLPGTIGTVASTPLNQITAAHNTLLNQSLQNLRLTLPGDTLYLLDVNTLYNQIVSDPGRYGYTDVMHAYTSVANANPLTAGDPNTYLFWDNLHPTAPGHQLIANLAYSVAVPEPSCVAMLSAFVLSGAAFLRRRRQKRALV